MAKGPHHGLTDIQRFWKQTRAERGCLMWTGHLGNRYGRFRTGGRRGRNTVPHRWIYQQVFGELPSEVLVMHTCDRPGCVSLQHLTVGTSKQNTQDMLAKGRRPTTYARRKDRHAHRNQESARQP